LPQNGRILGLTSQWVAYTLTGIADLRWYWLVVQKLFSDAQKAQLAMAYLFFALMKP